MDRRMRCRARCAGGAMINGCVLLVAVAMIVSTLGMHFAGHPPFHVAIATATITFALILARAPDSGWQVQALAAIGAPALISATIGYVSRPDFDSLKGTSALLYVSGTALYVLSCIIRGARGEAIDHSSTEEDPS